MRSWARVRVRDGKGEDRDQEDRELDEPAGDLLEEEERDHEKGQGDFHSLQCQGLPRRLLQLRQDG